MATAEKKNTAAPARAAAEIKPEKQALSEHFMPGKTRCRFCQATVGVRHTERQVLSDGVVLVTRNVKCNGPKRHTYQINDSYKPAKR